MYKSCLVAIAAAVCICGSSMGAQAGPYPFGDEPYRLDWSPYPDPEITNGCWKWNWQQYQWDNYCPVYVRPKAYMYPRARAVVVRSKG